MPLMLRDPNHLPASMTKSGLAPRCLGWHLQGVHKETHNFGRPYVVSLKDWTWKSDLGDFFFPLLGLVLVFRRLVISAASPASLGFGAVYWL